jgi:DnaJ-domain-containing protein 1
MARTRRGSSVAETARQRLAGVKQINPAPNLGTSLANYEQEITAFVAELDAYNQLLATLDDKQNSLDANEDALKDMNKRVLAAIGAQYGTDSSEYEMCGGTRTSERKRPSGRPPSGGTPPTT